VLELGVDDEQAKQQLERFNRQVESVKQSLIGLERQFSTLGRNIPSLTTGINIFDPMSQQERTFFESQQRLASTRIFQENKLAQQQIDTQKELIAQLKETSEFNRALFGDVTEDLGETKRSLLEASDIIKKLLPFAETAERPVGVRGRAPRAYETLRDVQGRITGTQVRQEYLEFQRPRLEPIAEARALAQRLAQDPQTEEAIKDYINVINNTIKQVAEQASVSPAQVEEMLEIIKPSVVSTQQALQTPFMGAREETLDELEAQIQALKSPGYEISGIESGEESLDELQRQIDLLKAGGTLDTEPMETPTSGIAPETRLPTILRQLIQEQQKRRISSFVGDIRDIIQPELEFEERIRQRGYITGFEKRGIGIQRRVEAFGTGLQETAKDKLIEFMTKERSFAGRKFAFAEKAEDFIERREKEREEAAERIQNKYEINIYNPTVRTDEDIEKMKRELRAALSGV